VPGHLKWYPEDLRSAHQRSLNLFASFLFDQAMGRTMDERILRSDHDVENFPWCFDCVPEENSLLLQFGKDFPSFPSPEERACLMSLF
jgi:hypothetical protein